MTLSNAEIVQPGGIFTSFRESPTVSVEAKPRLVPWETNAQERIEWLRAEAKKALILRAGRVEDHRSATLKDDGEGLMAAYDELVRRLAAAEAFLDEPNSARHWFRGGRVEGVWTNIHSATARLVELMDTRQLAGFVPKIDAAARAYLPPGDPMRCTLTSWLKKHDMSDPGKLNPSAADRQLLSNSLRTAYAYNADAFLRVRRFRNLLLGAAVCLALSVLILIAIGASKPDALSLCFPDSVVANAASTATVCPTGTYGHPTGGDVAFVAVLGLVGAALASTRSLTRSTEGSLQAYSLRVSRALVKAATGSVTALLGLILLRAGVVPGVTSLDTHSKIMAYAIVFGSAQQLLTKMVDATAESVQASASHAIPATPDRPGADGT
jgi:hypothetical protein